MDSLKLGIIGCGGIANNMHLPSIKKLGKAQVTAFCDIVPERAQKAAEEFGASDAKVFEDYRDLLGLVTLVVMRRGAAAGRRRTDLAGCRVILADNPVIDISSTDVRARIRRGLSVRYLLPEDVRRYIIETGLYRA